MRIAFTSATPEHDSDRSGKTYQAVDQSPFYKKINGDLNTNFLAARVTLNSMSEFRDHLTSAQAGDFNLYGIPHAPTDSDGHWIISPAFTEKTAPHHIARTREYFGYGSECGILFLDVDYNNMQIPDVLAAIYNAIPELKLYSHVYQPSSSAMVKDDAGRVSIVLTGLHLYFAISNPAKAKEFGDILFDRLWLSGKNQFAISTSGSFLKRSIIDASVWQPERIDYVGGSYLPANWSQDRPATLVAGSMGDVVPDGVWKPLSRAEKAEIARMEATMREDTGSVQRKARKAWEQAAKTPAERKAREVFSKTGFLTSDFSITLADKKVITISDLYLDPSIYDGCRCFDPIEGVAYGLCAKIFVNDEGPIVINSNAHGGTVYKALSNAWLADVVRNQGNGIERDSLINATLVAKNLTGSPENTIRFNRFANRAFIGTEPISDEHILKMRFKAAEHSIRLGKDIMSDGIMHVAHENAYHPVQSYLKSLKWDRKPRLHSWLVDYAGAEDNAAVRIFGSKFLISMVARIMKPGSKVDTVLLMYGKQGRFKSTMAKTLCGDPAYFSDTMPSMTNDADKARQHLAGKWVIEIAELSATRKADVNTVKSFLSTDTDTYRSPYDRIDKAVPRQCVFIATTNEETPLTDSTGNRRYWPVKIATEVNIKKLAQDRDQLFAEAVYLFENGETWWIDTNSEEFKIVDDITAEFVEEDPFTDILRDALAKTVVVNGVRQFEINRVTKSDIRQLLEINASGWNKLSSNRALKAMRSLTDWEEKKPKNVSVFVRKDTNIIPFPEGHTAEIIRPKFASLK